MHIKSSSTNKEKLSFNEFKIEVLNDYKIAVISRECSYLGRREVLTHKGEVVPEVEDSPEATEGVYISE